MSKEDVINYVMNSPANTNRAVLSGMLDSIANAGGGTEFLVVNVSIHSETMEEGGETATELTFTADKTLREIRESVPFLIASLKYDSNESNTYWLCPIFLVRDDSISIATFGDQYETLELWADALDDYPVGTRWQ